MTAPRVSGFTFVRNGVKFDYPVLESLRSLLPLVEELVIVVGKGEDETLDRVQALAAAEPKLKVFESVWDESLRKDGAILAQQTNLAISHCTGDWGLYLQADEVLHEDDCARIREAIERAGLVSAMPPAADAARPSQACATPANSDSAARSGCGKRFMDGLLRTG